MKIACAGMRRSGSTWLANCIRLICEQHGSVCFWFGVERPDKPPADYELQKVHKFSMDVAETADLIVTSHRDVRDVCASMMRRNLWKKRDKLLDKLVATICKEYQQWQAVSQFDMQYESMVHSPTLMVSRVSSLLGLACIPSYVAAALADMKAPEEGIDPTTQMNTMHRTDGRVGSYGETLDESEIELIERWFGPWLRRNGYETSCDPV